MSSVFVLLLVIALASMAILCAMLWRSLRPVDRQEVERFADSSHIHVSVANGDRILDAIARTRYWRVIGVITAAFLSVAFTIWRMLRTSSLQINLLILLVLLTGYYVGSVVAEYRTAHSDYGSGPRVASIRARQLCDYIDSWAQQWTTRLAFVGVAAAVVALVVGASFNWWAIAGFGAAVVAGVTAITARHIVERPATVESPELMLTDSAIRSRSLHAVFGATVGIQIWLVCLALIQVLASIATRLGWHVDELLAFVVLLVLAVIIPIRGMFTARALMRRPFVVRAFDVVTS